MTKELKLEVIGEIEKLTWEDFDKKETSIEQEVTANNQTYWLTMTIEEGGEMTHASLSHEDDEEEILTDEDLEFFAKIVEHQFASCIGDHFDAIENYNHLSDYNCI